MKPETLQDNEKPVPPAADGDGRSDTGGLHCVHRMPFGAQPVEDGEPAAGYSFRIWAPAESSLEVCLYGADGRKSCHPCTKSDGWHIRRIPEARPGDHYCFRLGSGMEVPDPASRFNPHDTHGPSELIDSTAFSWDAGWRGRPWEEAVIYELHVGTFTPEGNYAAAQEHLAELASLGVTAIELMPLADFSGQRGWGYDGVLPFAPDAAYGTPAELKEFIQSAHRLNLMVFLDVVYNHFGPDGNYLHGYAPEFFTRKYETPWGEAIAFDAPHSATVREFFIHNALYWLEEYRFDGLRLDAVHAIFDASQPDILTELSQRVRARLSDRHIHLVLENVDNAASRLAPPRTGGRYEAQWNDDFHHAAHVVLTGERDGYYADFADAPVRHLVRCLSEGFAFQGDHSAFHDAPRGEPSSGLPLTAFVNFVQNHDQVGNRAFGERLTQLVAPHKLRAMVALQLLAPSPPMLFMGEEAGSTTPFLYFCDYPGELGEAVREGRRREFGSFDTFGAEGDREIPDPCAPSTFAASKLDWDARATREGREWLDFYRELLERRHTVVVPRVRSLVPGRSSTLFAGDHAFEVRWPAVDGVALVLRANLGDEVSARFPAPGGKPFVTVGNDGQAEDRLGAWTLRGYLVTDGGQPA